MSEAWIIDACRTPRSIGKKGKGALSNEHPQHLGSAVLKALQERNNINTAEVDDIIFGTSNQSGRQGGDLARMSVTILKPAALPSIASVVQVSPR